MKGIGVFRSRQFTTSTVQKSYEWTGVPTVTAIQVIFVNWEDTNKMEICNCNASVQRRLLIRCEELQTNRPISDLRCQ